MPRITYDAIKKDFQYLESVCPGGDMAEIDASVFDLMANPTKSRAKLMYESAIKQWFYSVGSKGYQSGGRIEPEVLADSRVQEIGQKYGHL